MIPKKVKHTDLLTAMEPLCTLLGITPKHLYSWPPMLIGADFVTFTVPATTDEAKWEQARPEALAAGAFDPQGNDWSELSIAIKVEVEL